MKLNESKGSDLLFPTPEFCRNLLLVDAKKRVERRRERCTCKNWVLSVDLSMQLRPMTRYSEVHTHVHACMPSRVTLKWTLNLKGWWKTISSCVIERVCGHGSQLMWMRRVIETLNMAADFSPVRVSYVNPLTKDWLYRLPPTHMCTPTNTQTTITVSLGVLHVCPLCCFSVFAHVFVQLQQVIIVTRYLLFIIVLLKNNLLWILFRFKNSNYPHMSWAGLRQGWPVGGSVALWWHSAEKGCSSNEKSLPSYHPSSTFPRALKFTVVAHWRLKLTKALRTIFNP